MAKLTDDQIRFIIDLDAKGTQGQINSLEVSINSLEKENRNLQNTIAANEKEMADLEKQMEKLCKKGLENSNAYKNLQKQYDGSRQSAAQFKQELEQNNKKLELSRRSVQNLTNGLKTNEMSMRQLRQRARQLQQQLDATSKSASPETYEKLSRELENTQKAMGRLSEKSKTLKSATSTFLGNIASAAYIKGLQLLTSAIRSGVQTIIDFEQENANLASVLGKSQQQVQALTDDAKRLGAQTQYTASQITQLQTELAKLGFSETEILNSTEAVQAFATATGATLPEAAALAGAALRAFGLDSSEMERVVSTMGVATSKSALNFTYLQNSLSTIAPVAKQFGFTIEDTTALLGTLANSGFDASSAATATRNILLNLADSSGKLAKRLGEPIRSMNDLVPALRKLKDGGVDLAEALELTDKRSVAAFATFLEGTDTLQDLRDSITGVSDELHQMEKERLQTVQGSLTLLSSAWDGLMLSFSNSKGPIKTAIDWLTSLVNKVNELAGGNAQKLTEQQIRLGEYYKSYEEFSKMSYEQAKEYYNQELKLAEDFVKDRTDFIDSISDREDERSKKEREDQRIAITQRVIYMEEMHKLLLEKQADDEAAQQQAREAQKAADKQAEQEAREARQQRFQEQVAALKQELESELTTQAENYLQRKVSKEKYEEEVTRLTLSNYEKQLQLARQYGIDITKFEKQLTSERLKQRLSSDQAEKKAAEDALRAQLQSAKETQRVTLKAADTIHKAELRELERQRDAKLLTDTDYQKRKQQIEEAYLQARLAAAVIYAEQVKEQDQAVVDAARQAVEAAQSQLDIALQNRLSQAREYMSELRDVFQTTAAVLGDTLGGQLMKQFASAMDAIILFQKQSEEGFKSSADAIAAHANMIGSTLTALLSSVTAITKQIFELETAQLEAEKQKQLTIAGDNAEKREQIEQEYAEKELELKKQQADANAALQSAQLWISTATGIANAWATAMMIPFPFGEIIASALTAALLATAGIQQAAIIKQRDAIKNTTLQSSGTSSTGTSQTASGTKVTASLRDEFKVGNNANTGTTNKRQYADGGYTGDGAVLQPAGIVHKGEYVVAQAEMRNPSVIPMVRAIESVRQKRIGGKQTQRSFANGGFTGAASDYVNDTLLDKISQLADQIEEIKKTPLRASVNYQEFAQADRIMTTIKNKASK